MPRGRLAVNATDEAAVAMGCKSAFGETALRLAGLGGQELADGVFEPLDTLVEGGGDGQDLGAGNAPFEFAKVRFGVGFVHFVGDHQARTVDESGVIVPEFLKQAVIVIPGQSTVHGGHVEQDNKRLAALDVAEEGMTEPDVAVGAFDEAGYVADGDPGVVRVFDNADMGIEGGEGVGGDAGTRGRDCGQQRGFAGIGVADEADLGQEPQFEPEMTFFARFTGLGESGCLPRGGGEIAIAQAASAAAAEQELLAVLGEIGDEFSAQSIGKMGRRRGRGDWFLLTAGVSQGGPSGRRQETRFRLGV